MECFPMELISMHLGKFHIRVAGLLPVLILSFTLVSAGTDTTQRDPYAENTVRAALTDTNGPTYAFTEKVLNRLGDRAAIGLIRVIGEQSSSLRPDQLRRMLQFIQTS